MNKKRTIILLGLLLIVIAVLLNVYDMQVILVKAFRLNREIKRFDTNGRIHGKYLKIEKGNIILEANYQHGSAEGTFKTYYSDGKIKYKAFYKSNRVFGVDYGYYQNGTAYNGTDSFVGQVGAALAELNKGAIGQALVSTLESSTNTTTILNDTGKRGNLAANDGSQVRWDPNGK